MALLGTNGRRSPWSCQGWIPSVGECWGGGHGGMDVEVNTLIEGEGEGGGRGGSGLMVRKPGRGITFEM